MLLLIYVAMLTPTLYINSFKTSSTIFEVVMGHTSKNPTQNTVHFLKIIFPTAQYEYVKEHVSLYKYVDVCACSPGCAFQHLHR